MAALFLYQQHGLGNKADLEKYKRRHRNGKIVFL